MTDLYAALALLLVFEGLMPLASPARWKEALRYVAELPDNTLRLAGAAMVGTGLLCLQWIRS